MSLRVEQGKGKKDRYTLLSERLLQELRQYWQQYRPLPWLFLGQDGKRPLNRSSAQRGTTFLDYAHRYRDEVLLKDRDARDSIQLAMQIRALAQIPRQRSGLMLAPRIGDLFARQEQDGGWKLDIRYFGSTALTDRRSSPAVTALAVETLIEVGEAADVAQRCDDGPGERLVAKGQMTPAGR